jgi:hypothetical protein
MMRLANFGASCNFLVGCDGRRFRFSEASTFLQSTVSEVNDILKTTVMLVTYMFIGRPRPSGAQHRQNCVPHIMVKGDCS